MKALLGDVLTAIVTPFGRDGSVDFERFREHARRTYGMTPSE